MDIKIGKQTWDPEASPNKIAKEEVSKIHIEFILIYINYILYIYKCIN